MHIYSYRALMVNVFSIQISLMPAEIEIDRYLREVEGCGPAAAFIFQFQLYLKRASCAEILYIFYFEIHCSSRLLLFSFIDILVV